MKWRHVAIGIFYFENLWAQKDFKAARIGFARLLLFLYMFYTLKLQDCWMHNPVECWYYRLPLWTELLASTLRNGLHRWRGMVGCLWSSPQCKWVKSEHPKCQTQYNKHAHLWTPVLTVCHTCWRWTWPSDMQCESMKYMLIWAAYLLPLAIFIDVRSTTVPVLVACSGFACIHWLRAQLSLLVSMFSFQQPMWVVMHM